MILYLCNGDNDLMQCQNISDIAQIDTKWKHKNRWWRAVDKKCFEKIRLCPQNLFLGKWAKDIGLYDCIIIEALQANKPLIEYIKKNAKADTRIILWHWNKLYAQSVQPDDAICAGCELWSFEPEDCKKYGMQYNTQYYDTKNRIQYNGNILYDVWFVGADKGRLGKLLTIQDMFDKYHVSYSFHVTKSPESFMDYPYKKSITYKENLSCLAKSKAILDVPKEGQTGLTLRPLEALFNQKKIITTDKSIAEYNFYCSDNIFIIGKDSWEKLRDFLDSPFNHSIQKNLQSYQLSEWIKRFDKNQQSDNV